MKRNILFVILVLALCFATAPYFGSLYDYFSPQEGSAFWGPDKSAAIYLAGFPFAYVFFLIITLKLFGQGNRNRWIGWLLVPALLFFGMGDIRHIYLPIALGLVAWGIASLVQKIFKKSATTI